MKTTIELWKADEDVTLQHMLQVLASKAMAGELAHHSGAGWHAVISRSDVPDAPSADDGTPQPDQGASIANAIEILIHDKVAGRSMDSGNATLRDRINAALASR